MSPALETVLRELPHLKPEEIAKVRSRLGAAASFSKAAPIEEIDYLFDGVQCELRRRGLLGRNAVLPRRVVPVGYEQAASEVRDHLGQSVGSLSSLDRVALGQLAARELAAYLERGKIPISPKTLLTNIDKIPSAIDASFPGYLEAGVLSSCWRK